jgi:hypothetical protein
MLQQNQLKLKQAAAETRAQSNFKHVLRNSIMLQCYSHGHSAACVMRSNSRITLHMKLVEGGPKLAVIAPVSGFILHTAAGLGSAMLYW